MHKFQEHQEAAKNQSTRLKLLMSATIFTTVMICGAAITYLFYVAMFLHPRYSPEGNGLSLLATFIGTILLTTTVIVSGTLLKIVQLRAGGRVIAEDVGGILLEEPRDHSERVLMNIVEEMAIASGMPIPPVYVMESDGINAFAAGNTTKDCVIGITRGAIEKLKRDEIQGVIAHEFSHILNGDMRLNMQLTGWMHGLLAVSIVASQLIAWSCITVGSTHDRRSRSSRHGRHNKGDLLLLAVGCTLWPIGQIGAGISALVKAAMNRQREYLADAYAVEFTRNPQGLADALRRVLGHKQGGRVDSPKAIEASHMFFSNFSRRSHRKWATHPPLADRILRLTPDWDGAPLFPEVQGEREKKHASPFAGAMEVATALSQNPAVAATGMDDPPPVMSAAPETCVAKFAATTALMSAIMERIPDPIIKLAKADKGMPLVLYGLWIANSREPQTAVAVLGAHDAGRIRPLIDHLKELPVAEQLLVFDTVVGQLSQSEANGPIDCIEFRQRALQLIEHSEEDNLFQWMWGIVMIDALDMRPALTPRFSSLAEVAPCCSIVLSQLCHRGDMTEMATRFAFQRALAKLGLDQVELLEKERCDWDSFQRALDLLAQLAPVPRRQLARACAAAISSDEKVASDEAFLIRGICQRLGYAMPCVVPGQPIALGV